LGGLSAALSVTSPDTIHPGLNCDALLQCATENRFELDSKVMACLVRA
jgi:hypothetical protein